MTRARNGWKKSASSFGAEVDQSTCRVDRRTHSDMTSLPPVSATLQALATVRSERDHQLLDGFEMTENTSFEDLLADAQSEMIAVSLEYSKRKASEIFIFATADGGMFTFDPFFVVNGSVVERHKLSGVDTSMDRQRALLKYGNAQLIRLAGGSKSFGRPLPTLFKLRFNVSSRSLDAEYSYEPLFEGAPTTTPLSLREDWQREIQAGLEPLAHL